MSEGESSRDELGAPPPARQMRLEGSKYVCVCVCHGYTRTQYMHTQTYGGPQSQSRTLWVTVHMYTHMHACRHTYMHTLLHKHTYIGTAVNQAASSLDLGSQTHLTPTSTTIVSGAGQTHYAGVQSYQLPGVQPVHPSTWMGPSQLPFTHVQPSYQQESYFPPIRPSAAPFPLTVIPY